MFSNELLHPSINKGVVITAAGATPVVGYGAKELWNQPLQEDKTLPLSKIQLLSQATEDKLGSPEPDKNSTAKLIATVPTSNTSGTEKTSIPLPQKIKEPETYPIDYSYFKTIKSHSIGGRFKDYVLLVNKNHQVWKSKSQKLKEMAKKAGGGDFGTYWGGYLKEKDLTPQFAHRFCNIALSYSEGTTLFTIGMSEKYMNLLGTTCGRDDKSKPVGGGYT